MLSEFRLLVQAFAACWSANRRMIWWKMTMVGCLACALQSVRNETDQFRRSKRYSFYLFHHSFIHATWFFVSYGSSQLGLIQSIHNNFLLQLLIVLEEAIEQVHGVLDVMGTTRLTDTVHAELRVAQIKGASTHGC